jgi:hypothetical protein
MTPADVYEGIERKILSEREAIKRQLMIPKRLGNQRLVVAITIY